MTDWKDLLAFNRRERNGILLLTGCMIAFITVRFILSFDTHNDTFIARLESIDIAIKRENLQKSAEIQEEEANPSDTPFKEYSALSSVPKETGAYPTTVTERQTFHPTELNQADSAMLEKLPLIGGKLASRIIKFRNALGGFHSIDQVKEVYGVSPEALQILDSLCVVDESKLAFLRINSIEQGYTYHPYVSSNQWKAIRSYVQKHGALKSCEDLKSTLVISETEISRLCPYLQFN